MPLIERKRILRRLVPPQPSRLLYVDHIDGRGVDLFREVCRQDLEGIVAKRRDGVYDPDAPTWIKIKNPEYSQAGAATSSLTAHGLHGRSLRTRPGWSQDVATRR
jgi:ATP-dependent DNA ligase